MTNKIFGGTVHELPEDLKNNLKNNKKVLSVWDSITQLAINEFICWVESAKESKTRERRIRRTTEELETGMRRPCCWPGCPHR